MAKHNTLALFGEAVQTSDATVTSLSTFTTKPSKAYLVTAKVVALNATDLTQGAGYVRYASFRTDAAGVLTQIGATAATATIEDNAAWDATIDASGTDIRVRVTGAAATLVNWRGDININRVGTDSEYT